MAVDQTRKKLKKIEDAKTKPQNEVPARAVGLVTTVETPILKDVIKEPISVKPIELSRDEKSDRSRRASDTIVNRMGGDRRKNRAQAIEKAPAGTRTRMLKIIYDHKAKFQEQRQRSLLFRMIFIAVLLASAVTGIASSWSFIRDTSGQVIEVLDLDTWWSNVSSGHRAKGIEALPATPNYLEKSFNDLKGKIKAKTASKEKVKTTKINAKSAAVKKPAKITKKPKKTASKPAKRR